MADGDTLDLGGHVLKFATIPMVHWPESMVTFDASTGVLFSNDAFGGFGAHEGGLFDDQRERPRWEDDMLRYYAAILGRYFARKQNNFLILQPELKQHSSMTTPLLGTIIKAVAEIKNVPVEFKQNRLKPVNAQATTQIGRASCRERV